MALDEAHAFTSLTSAMFMKVVLNADFIIKDINSFIYLSPLRFLRLLNLPHPSFPMGYQVVTMLVEFHYAAMLNRPFTHSMRVPFRCLVQHLWAGFLPIVQ